MSRLDALADREFDVLIIGAGIHGAATAWYAACKGMRVALIDQGDYGAAASANSLKILHGGLRYLQQFDFPRMRESIRARRDAFARLPYLTRPATFLLPEGEGFKRSRWAYRVAGLLNDGISWDRNRGVPASHWIPRVTVWGRDDLRRECPALAGEHAAAMVWQDGFIENTERYTLAYVMSAREQGAICLNYVAATALSRSEGQVVGARVQDVENGESAEVRARMTINAAGCWMTECDAEQYWVKAYNLVTPRQWFGPYGVGLDSPRGQSPRRSFFFAPWRIGTMIGTVYTPFDPSQKSCTLQAEDVAEFVADINRMYPAAELSVDEVTFAHVGIQPAKLDTHGKPLPEPSGETRIIDHERTQGVQGYWSMRGVKYTTAAVRAERLCDQIAQRLGMLPQDAVDTPLYGAGRPVAWEDVQSSAEEQEWRMSEAMARTLVSEYGDRAGDVVQLAVSEPMLREPVPGTDYPQAVVVHAMRYEDAWHCDDVFLRRSGLGTLRAPTQEQETVVIERMASVAGWSPARCDAERRRLREQYARLGMRG